MYILELLITDLNIALGGLSFRNTFDIEGLILSFFSVCYIAGMFIRSLRERQPELGIDDCDVLCVEIAALCHDMGHGPFSHFYQDLFIPFFYKDRKWKVNKK